MKEAIPRLIAATGCTRAEALEEWSTRAAHMEYDAGLSRAEAEAAAYHDALRVLGEMMKGRK